jgi:hypothetical protein
MTAISIVFSSLQYKLLVTKFDNWKLASESQVFECPI